MKVTLVNVPPACFLGMHDLELEWHGANKYAIGCRRCRDTIAYLRWPQYIHGG